MALFADRTRAAHPAVRIEIGVNRSVRGKLGRSASRADWLRLNRGFVTERLDIAGLAQVIQAGHAITAVHAGPDGRPAERKRQNFVSAQHIGLDFDTGDTRSSLETLLADEFIRAHAALLHTTASHTPALPRARVIFILDHPVRDAQAYSRLAMALVRRFPDADPQCTDASRLWFGAAGCDCRVLGHVLAIADIRQMPEMRLGERFPAAGGPLAAIGQQIPGGQRNSTLTRIAGGLRRMGFSAEELQAALSAVNTRRCMPPLPAEEVRLIAQSVARYPSGTLPSSVPDGTLPGNIPDGELPSEPPPAPAPSPGRRPPPAALSETTRRFVDECCRIGAGGRVSERELYAAYRDWCAAHNRRARSNTLLAEEWRRLGLVKRSLRGRAYWYGIELK